MIKTWQQRCKDHPDHNGIVSDEMIRARMQEEIDELRAAIEQAQEPIAWVGPSWINPETRTWENEAFAPGPIDGWIPLYTAPRQWQGLTADEIWACNVAPAGHPVTYHISMANQNVLDFAEAIEAKLREKNT